MSQNNRNILGSMAMWKKFDFFRICGNFWLKHEIKSSQISIKLKCNVEPKNIKYVLLLWIWNYLDQTLFTEIFGLRIFSCGNCLPFSMSVPWYLLLHYCPFLYLYIGGTTLNDTI